MLALRDDDVRAEALGFPTYRYKLVVFVVAGALGGIAGALSVNLQGYVSPNALHWTQSGTLMVMVILGGVATVWGGLAGAAALLLLQEVLAATTEHHEFWTGWVLLAVVLFARQGIVGLWTRRRAPTLLMTDTATAAPLLDVRGLEKRFGGLVATDRVDLRVDAGEIHALIGPNGAGKTTLVAQLGGQLASDRGTIVFAGADITAWPTHRRARHGLARSFQITRLFRSASVHRQRRPRGPGGQRQQPRRVAAGAARHAPCSSARASCSPRSGSAPRRRIRSTSCRTASGAPSRSA